MNLKLKGKIIEKFGSQIDFAIKAGVDAPFVSMVVRGRKVLSEEQQQKWASMLGCSRKRLFYNENR